MLALLPVLNRILSTTWPGDYLNLRKTTSNTEITQIQVCLWSAELGFCFLQGDSACWRVQVLGLVGFFYSLMNLEKALNSEANTLKLFKR